jgi:hypothetical protein
MHRIVSTHPAVTEARDNLATARANLEAYEAKVAAAHATYDADVKAALDRGETHCPPMVPLPTAEVKAHVANRLRVAEEHYESTLNRLAVELIPRFEARELELLADVPKTKAGALGPVVDEIAQLVATKSDLLRRHRKMVVHRSSAQGAPAVFAPISQQPVTAGSVVDTAAIGGSLVGQTAPAGEVPERTPMFTKELAGTLPT